MSALTVGQRIRKARRDKDMTQEDLAKLLGTTKATINRYESGVISNIPKSKIELLARALDLQPSDLFTYEETLESYRQQMDSAKQEIAELEHEIAENRQAGRKLEDMTKELDRLQEKKAELASKAIDYEQLLRHQFQVFLSYTNSKDVPKALSDLAVNPVEQPETKEPSTAFDPAEAVGPFVSSGRPGPDPSARQLSPQEQELLRIYNMISVRRQMELLSFAYSLEDQEK